MGAQLKLIYRAGDSLAHFASKLDPLEDAAMGAVREAGDLIKREGRASILAGGLGRKFANALRVDFYPKRGKSIDAAALAHHNIPYADVFEDGKTIHGSPLLWIPLPTTPKTTGGRFGKRLTPGQVATRYGDLFSINRPGFPPLLAARVAGRSGVGARGFRNVTRAALGKVGGVNHMQPLFFGVDAAKEKKRMNLTAIFKAVGAALPRLFAAHLVDR